MNIYILNSFYTYLIVMIMIYIIKPNYFFYTQNNKCYFKSYGCGENKTIINIQIFSIILSILTYFLSRILN